MPVITLSWKGSGVLWWSCLSVCLSVCQHICQTNHPKFINIFCLCCLWLWWFSLCVATWHYVKCKVLPVLYVLSCTSVMGPMAVWRYCSSLPAMLHASWHLCCITFGAFGHRQWQIPRQDESSMQWRSSVCITTLLTVIFRVCCNSCFFQ